MMAQLERDRTGMSRGRTTRRGGWWGVAFVITLLVTAAMVSLPTSAKSGQQITGFYRAHAGLILVQQVLGVLTVVFFLAFARVLGAGRRRWLLVGTVMVAIAELATNIPPVILAVTQPAPDAAYALTVVEDFADAALGASIAVFSVAATINEVGWLRISGLVVAAVSVIRAGTAPSGITALEVLAPIAFLALILLLSIRLLIGNHPAAPDA